MFNFLGPLVPDVGDPTREFSETFQHSEPGPLEIIWGVLI